MLASFRKLLHLEQLSIRIAVWEEHRDTFLRCSFPHLLSCHLGLATIGEGGIFPLVTSFLERHPSLRTFSTPLKAFSRDGADPLIPFSLPHLQNFRGPATLVPVISGTQDLREVRLSWFRQHSAQDIEEIARTLKSMTREDFPFICSNYDCDNSFIEVLESISRNLPHTNTLEMRGYGFNVSNEIKLSHLKNCLPRFTGLRVLSLAMAVDDDDPASREEATRRMTRDLGDICPSLEACRLNTYAWRKVNAMWEQYPADDFPELASISFPEVLH
ncbi:hypothetical protein B0H19DRAFT_425093 [Mycena capillaripes]|nr:hypothetical protein B0H19DRAFT_425093 [Mycena capillaripes]